MTRACGGRAAMTAWMSSTVRREAMARGSFLGRRAIGGSGGAAGLRFQVRGAIFANLLDGSLLVEFPGDVDADQLGRVYAPLHRIGLVHVEAHGAVFVTDDVERGRIVRLVHAGCLTQAERRCQNAGGGAKPRRRRTTKTVKATA